MSRPQFVKKLVGSIGKNYFPLIKITVISWKFVWIEWIDYLHLHFLQFSSKKTTTTIPLTSRRKRKKHKNLKQFRSVNSHYGQPDPLQIEISRLKANSTIRVNYQLTIDRSKLRTRKILPTQVIGNTENSRTRRHKLQEFESCLTLLTNTLLEKNNMVPAPPSRIIMTKLK